MKNRVQRQLIYRVMWNDEVLSANIAPLSITRHLSIWQFSHDSWRGASLASRGPRVKQQMLTLSSLIGRNTDAIRGLVHRNMGRGLIGWLIKVSRGVSFHCKPSTVKQIGWFCSRLRYLMRTQGEAGTTLYLKSCQVLLQQSIAGYKVRDITELKCRVKRNKAGMPRIIPAGVRKRIREGDVDSIKLWMTLFGWYRICQFRGLLKLSTITDPGKKLPLRLIQEWESFLEKQFWPTFTRILNPGKEVKLSPIQPFPISKSSPTSVGEIKDKQGNIIERAIVSTSFYSLVSASKIWVNSDLKPTLVSFLNKWAKKDGKRFHPLMERIGWAAQNEWHFQDRKDLIVHSSEEPKGLDGLAKLGFKEEAAGKVRVFAMVDAFTQWVMSPIHKCIFDLLRNVPTDGTFDQTKPVERLRKLSSFNRWYYSIDLSAATDRLPILLQIPLMRNLFKSVSFPEPAEAAQEWADLLVKRHYKVTVPPEKSRGFDIPDDLPSYVTYSVGQPMGALSSWAMLALTHHAIVQWAALRAKNRGFAIKMWFSEYAILGDDIVIANRHVAIEYLQILSQIGVKAGLAKSIVSKGQFVVEFAKKYFIPDGRADMLPFKEIVATLSSTLLVCEFVKIHKLRLSQILTILGYGYKTKSRAAQALYKDLNRRLRTLLIWFRSPKGCYPLGSKQWLLSSGFNSTWDIPEDPEHMVWWFTYRAIRSECQYQLARYYKAATKYKEAIEITGAIREPMEPFSGKPLSYHPSHLCEIMLRDDGTNSLYPGKLSFKHLVAPFDYEVPKDKGLAYFQEQFNVFDPDKLDVNVASLPQSLIDHKLGKAFMEIDHSSKPYFTKCYEALDWLFSYDDIASEIPVDFWPTYRVVDKPIREFIMIVKWHERFTKAFSEPRWNFSPRLPRLKSINYSGNKLVIGPTDIVTESRLFDTYTEANEVLEPPRYVHVDYNWAFQWQQPCGVNDLTGTQWYDHIETCWRNSLNLPQTHGMVSLKRRNDIRLSYFPLPE